MKKQMIRSLFVCAAAFLLAGCASVQKYGQVSGQFPQLAAGQGRIYFYRGNEFSFGRAGVITKVSLNGEKIENLNSGCFFYVDRPAGDYFIQLQTGLLDTGQSKHKLTFALASGDTKYIRIVEHWGLVTSDAEPTLEDTDSALKTLSDCNYTAVNK